MKSSPRLPVRAHGQVALHHSLVRTHNLEELELEHQDDDPHRLLIENECSTADGELSIGIGFGENLPEASGEQVGKDGQAEQSACHQGQSLQEISVDNRFQPTRDRVSGDQNPKNADDICQLDTAHSLKR